MNWDILISAGVILALVIVVICKVTKQTFPEFVSGMRDLFRDKKEDLVPAYEMPY